jgi:hypothetical protein
MLLVYGCIKSCGEKLWLNDSTQLEISGVLKDFNYEGAGRSLTLLHSEQRMMHTPIYMWKQQETIKLQ